MEVDFLVEELLNFPVSRVKAYWVIDSSEETVIGQPTLRSIRFNVPAGLKPFSGLQALFETLRLDNEAGLIEKISTYWEALLVEYPALFGGVVTSYALDNPASASSDFTATAGFIDSLAQFVEICLKTAQISQVVCTNTHQLDALSLRLLARFHQIAELEEVSFIYLFPTNPLAEPKIPDVFSRLRQQLFVKLAPRFAPEIIKPALAQTPPPLQKELRKKPHALAIFEECNSFQESLAELVTAFRYQTFERAYLLCDRALKLSFGQPAKQALILGFMALLEALSGQIGLALESVRAAMVEIPQKPLLLSHLHYLHGLILLNSEIGKTKAELSFQQGLALLGETEPSTPAKAPGEAWLYYGLSLQSSSAVKSLAEIEPEEAFNYSYQALQLLENEATPAMSFLYPRVQLQLASYPGKTEDTLTQIFSLLADLVDESYPQDTPFRIHKRLAYRAGIKYYQAGQPGEALKCLTQARQLAETEQDNYSLIRILYVIGLLHCQSGKLVVGRAVFEQGLALARQQHDWEGLRQHLLGWLWFRQPLGNNPAEEAELASSLKELFNLCDPPKSQPQRDHRQYQASASWLELPQFEVELPATNPFIDLGYSEALLDWAVSIFHFCAGNENDTCASTGLQFTHEDLLAEEASTLLRPISQFKFAMN